MTDPRKEELPADDLRLHLTVDDTRTTQLAGCKFARTLAGAHPVDYALALAEQEHLVERAITDAGFSGEQARLAAGHFGVAARDEWERIGGAGGSGTWGTA